MAETKPKKTTADAPKGKLADGIYTEQDVELRNGRKVPIEVIVDDKKLPATYGSLLAEGNGPALTIAALTTKTRRILDFTGATMEDLDGAVAEVIMRGREMPDKA